MGRWMDGWMDRLTDGRDVGTGKAEGVVGWKYIGFGRWLHRGGLEPFKGTVR